ncbi:hypothetical protein Dimus_018895 [Dionaea muscipula]
MAQLPPKTPSMTQNWPPFPPQHHKNILPPLSHNMLPAPSSTAQHHPSWVDEFLDFTSARRGAHRRSMSDSVTFLEMPAVLADQCRDSFGNGGGGGFDRLDDEQLMSMFSDDLSGGCPVLRMGNSSNPSTPSDQNSNNIDQENKAMPVPMPMPMPTPMDQEKQQQQQIQQQQQVRQPKVEPGEVESSCKDEPPLPSNNTPDPINIDPKRVKRILANRQSAQRSRVRKLQYISDLERSVTALQTEVSALSPRVAFLDHQRLILNVDNSALRQRIAALAQDRLFKDAHQEALKKEIERLRQIYHKQSLKKMDGAANTVAAAELPEPTAPAPPPDDFGWADKEQLIST